MRRADAIGSLHLLDDPVLARIIWSIWSSGKILAIYMQNGWPHPVSGMTYSSLLCLHCISIYVLRHREEGSHGVGKMKKFVNTEEAQAMLDEEEDRVMRGEDHPDSSEFFDPDYLQVDRILYEKRISIEEEVPPPPGSSEPPKKEIRNRKCYLVKWMGLGYGQATWEFEEDVKDDAKIAQYRRFNREPSLADISGREAEDIRPPASEWKKYAASMDYKGRELRDYQLEGLNWLVFNWYNRRNCILADEMGLGKTIQTLSFLEHLRTREHIRGPFLVLAPLSTLENWRRELESWTDMNVVVYHQGDRGTLSGSEVRAMIRDYEFYYKNPQLAKAGVYKFNVLVTSYTLLNMDWDFLKDIVWKAVVVDEAHAAKNRDSLLKLALENMKYHSLLLLTGTPLQNDMEELWSLLNLIDKEKFSDAASFLANYGELTRSEQVAKLQEDLRPYMLRRVKEDVEKSIPPKEETIVSVELTTMQKKYYRAVFERNRAFLTAGMKRSQVAQLSNVELELRKCCNHPFLLRGVKQREVSLLEGAPRGSAHDLNIESSGKTILLDKLLPKLRAENHRVLIFSQFTSMLNLLEDLLSHRGYSYERIDGSVQGNERQAAIDRFNRPGSDVFAFLLTTRAGGQGINLTSADTVIIYDSDWNPQNDLQATARCHRIGQTTSVRVYRLVTKKTYEAEMFRRASRKLGLSQAVFESGGVASTFSGEVDDMSSGGFQNLLRMDKEQVETLLRFGAYAIMDDDGQGEREFREADIDKILDTRSTTIRYDESGKASIQLKDGSLQPLGNDGEEDGSSKPQRSMLNFSQATFVAEGSDEGLDIKDPTFWEKVLGPKKADSLLAAVTTGQLESAGAEKQRELLQGLKDLVEAAIAARMEGGIHEDQETLNACLEELRIRGKDAEVLARENESAAEQQDVAMEPAAESPQPEGDEDMEGSTPDGGPQFSRADKQSPKFGQILVGKKLALLANEWLEMLEGFSRRRRSMMATGGDTPSSRRKASSLAQMALSLPSDDEMSDMSGGGKSKSRPKSKSHKKAKTPNGSTTPSASKWSRKRADKKGSKALPSASPVIDDDDDDGDREDGGYPTTASSPPIEEDEAVRAARAAVERARAAGLWPYDFNPYESTLRARLKRAPEKDEGAIAAYDLRVLFSMRTGMTFPQDKRFKPVPVDSEILEASAAADAAAESSNTSRKRRKVPATQ